MTLRTAASMSQRLSTRPVPRIGAHRAPSAAVDELVSLRLEYANHATATASKGDKVANVPNAMCLSNASTAIRPIVEHLCHPSTLAVVSDSTATDRRPGGPACGNVTRPTENLWHTTLAMGRELPSRWLFVVALTVLAAAAVVVAVDLFFPRKLSAAGTERALRNYTTYKSINCKREAGRLWRGWDYGCTGRSGRECDVFDVEVSTKDVVDLSFPGSCLRR